MTLTIADLLADHTPDRPAIGGHGRPWLTYGDLATLADTTRAALHGAGIGRGDRVGIVLPNGPEMATAFIAIAQTATTAPLNPAYTREEFEFYLGDLDARALVVPKGYDGPALQAAARFGLRVLRLSVDPDAPAGAFALSAEDTAAVTDPSPPGPGDVALILHTSGTTSRPKIVPLLQSNIVASAQNVAGSLQLSPVDRCLNVMPLFHIHGLIAAVTASLAAGGSIWCSGGFNALRFFADLEASGATWYTAVPTMHQAILSRAERNRDIIRTARLRFLRSSSASLPAPVMRALQEAFGAPVIEAYGMTEAAHQMACNPLGIGAQKPGSVGPPAGPAMRIADEADDRLLDRSDTGEVVISGSNVTPGYEGNPGANETAFFHADGCRWFRTGDQGAFDADGYLHLTGRLKEIINRGGEKISPLEIDSVLLDHPSVAQAVAFAIPHSRLGEDIGAAVVARDGTVLDAQDIRAFASTRLAHFKVPRRIVVLDEIPKGATGKVQRIGLAERLGLIASTPDARRG